MNGLLYGTTQGGGSKNSGVIFSIAPARGRFKTIHTFQDIPDGNLPNANLVAYRGQLYGTTIGGGTAGEGTVFEITTTGKERVLYSFQGGTDGASPYGPVLPFGGALYGTTNTGGASKCSNGGITSELVGCGTVYRVNP